MLYEIADRLDKLKDFLVCFSSAGGSPKNSVPRSANPPKFALLTHFRLVWKGTGVRRSPEVLVNGFAAAPRRGNIVQRPSRLAEKGQHGPAIAFRITYQRCISSVQFTLAEFEL